MNRLTSKKIMESTFMTIRLRRILNIATLGDRMVRKDSVSEKITLELRCHQYKRASLHRPR